MLVDIIAQRKIQFWKNVCSTKAIHMITSVCTNCIFQNSIYRLRFWPISWWNMLSPSVSCHTKRVLDKKCDDAIRHLFCRSVSLSKLTNIVIFCYDARIIFCGTGLRKRQHSLEGLVNLITREFSRSLITNALSATTSGVPGAQSGGYHRHP